MNQIVINNFNYNDILKIICNKKSKNFFVVTGKESYHLTGAKKILDKVFSNIEYDFNLSFFNHFSVNPKFEEVIIGTNKFIKYKCDFIIAVGGGSVLDMAKSINVFQSNPKISPDEIVEKNIIKPIFQHQENIFPRGLSIMS